MSLEKLLQDALHSADSYEPSPDLFARVARSVEEDAAHRRRVATAVLGTVASAVILALFTGAFIATGNGGRPVIPAWVLEAAESAVMLGVLLVLGPAIRRFGRNYVDDVFGITEGIGRRFLQLLDIAYYLVFAGVILVSVEVAELQKDLFLGEGLEDSLTRIAALLLAMGALHAATLLVLPAIGFVYSSLIWQGYRDRLGRDPRPPSPGAAQAARVMRIVVIVVAVIVALQLMFLFVALVLGVLGF